MIKLNLPDLAYTPGGISRLQVVSERDARAEYSRLRSIARKRIERLGKSEFASLPIYTYNVEKFIPLKEVKTTSQLGGLLGDVRQFLESRGSTIRGQRQIRKDTIRTLHQHGFRFINESNIDKFGEFMERVRAMYEENLVHKLPSDMLADLYEFVDANPKIDTNDIMKDFSKWVEHINEIDINDEEYLNKDSEFFRELWQ